MQNSKNNAQNTPETYTTGDMLDVYSLAESDMQWMRVAIADVRKRLRDIKKEFGNKGVTGFYDLEHIVDMYQYIAECRSRHYSDKAEVYQAEFDANEKAVTL